MVHYTSNGITGFKQISTLNNVNFNVVLAVYNDCANFPTNYTACEALTLEFVLSNKVGPCWIDKALLHSKLSVVSSKP